jgi:hypothetical protein
VGIRRRRWMGGGRGASTKEIRRPEATDGERREGPPSLSSPLVDFGERRLLLLVLDRDCGRLWGERDAGREGVRPVR